MAYSFSNKCAKHLCKRTVLVQLIVVDAVTCFLEHSVVFVVVNILTFLSPHVFVSNIRG